MFSKIRVTFTGAASKQFLKKYFGKKLKQYDTRKIASNHWIIEIPEDEISSDHLKQHVQSFLKDYEKRFFPKLGNSRDSTRKYVEYKIQKIFYFDENEIEPGFTRINWS